MKGQEQTCSGCGHMNHYTKKELEEVFPYSRERLICEKCGRHLSVCSYFGGVI